MRNLNPLFLMLAASMAFPLFAGCQNASNLCRRETALLRAEILDLEDKYYALQAQHESVLAGGQPASSIIGGGTVGSGVIVNPSSAIGSSFAQGEIIYDGSVISDGEIIHNGVIHNGVIHNGTIQGGNVEFSGDVIYENGTTLPFAPEVYYPDAQPGALVNPGAANPGSLPITLEPTHGSSTRSEVTDGPGDSAFNLDLPGIQTDYGQTNAGQRPTSLKIDVNRTHGVNLDANDGDDGIVLMIASRDSAGNFAQPQSTLRVSVSEPSGTEIGKWTFVAEELALFISRDELDDTDGILLHLPWLDKVPTGTSVIVNVESSAGGQTLSDTASINIEGKSQRPQLEANGWSRSAPTIRRPARSRSTSVERPTWKPVR